MEYGDVASAYIEACKGVQEAIQKSRFKPTWILEQLGFGKSPSAFYRRLKEGNWTPTQLQKIGLLLEGKVLIAE